MQEIISDKAYYLINNLIKSINQVIVGQEEVVKKSIAAMLCDGHLLIEGPPGLAKTTLVKTLSEAVSCSFSRIQFTPDLMPSDITGSLVYNVKLNDFITRKGPLFANFILADEINRAPAKVQSALLEAMQERQVTIGEDTYPLPSPFWVLATQNPIEQEGTYRLPEAQADRFIMKILINYPDINNEIKITKKVLNNEVFISKSIISLDELQFLKQEIQKVFVDEKIFKFAASIVHSTREKSFANFLSFSASPRATIALIKLGRALALIEGRNYVLPEDIIYIARDVLRHRIGLTFEALADGKTNESIIDVIINTTNIP
jgi:MoxR-like ATPase